MTCISGHKWHEILMKNLLVSVLLKGSLIISFFFLPELFLMLFLFFTTFFSLYLKELKQVKDFIIVLSEKHCPLCVAAI